MHQYPLTKQSAIRDPLIAGFKIGNPKAILTWVAIMSFALKPDVVAATLPIIICGCAVICVVVFGGYALLFSTARLRTAEHSRRTQLRKSPHSRR